jgi:hypothetical protein
MFRNAPCLAFSVAARLCPRRVRRRERLRSAVARLVRSVDVLQEGTIEPKSVTAMSVTLSSGR